MEVSTRIPETQDRSRVKGLGALVGRGGDPSQQETEDQMDGLSHLPWAGSRALGPPVQNTSVYV